MNDFEDNKLLDFPETNFGCGFLIKSEDVLAINYCQSEGEDEDEDNSEEICPVAEFPRVAFRILTSEDLTDDD